MFKNGIMATEGVDETQELNGEDGALVIEQAMAAADEVSVEGERIEVGIFEVESAERDLYALESIGEKIESTVQDEEGGLDQTSAAVISIAVEGIMTRLGAGDEESLIPATESFEDVNERVLNTEIAVEGIKDTVAAGIKALMAAIKSIMDRIIGLFVNNGRAGKKVQEAADKLGDKVNKLGDMTAKTKTYKNTGVAKAFGFSNSNVTAKSVNDVLSTHIAITAGAEKTLAVFDTAATTLGKQVDEINKWLKDAKEEDKDAAKELRAEAFATVKGIVETLNKNLSAQKANSAMISEMATKEEQDKVDVFMVEGIVNGDTIMTSIAKDDVPGIRNIIKVRRIGLSANLAKIAAGQDVVTLGQSEAESILKNVKTLGKSMESVSKGGKKLGDYKKSLENALTTLSKAAKASGDKDEKKAAKAAIKSTKAAIGDAFSASNGLFGTIGTINGTASKAALSYVSSSVSNYKKDEK